MTACEQELHKRYKECLNNEQRGVESSARLGEGLLARTGESKVMMRLLSPIALLALSFCSPLSCEDVNRIKGTDHLARKATSMTSNLHIKDWVRILFWVIVLGFLLAVVARIFQRILAEE